MAKNKRFTALNGHLLDPFYKYFLKTDIYISPIDIKGNKAAKQLYFKLNNADRRLIIPGFKVNLKVDETSLNSYCDITFKNDYCNRIILTYVSYNNFEKDIHYYNRILENELIYDNEDVVYPEEFNVLH